MKIEDYIICVGVREGDYFNGEGYGVMVGRKVITAWHVVSKLAVPYYDDLYWGLINGFDMPFQLNGRNMVKWDFIDNDTNSQHYDYAVFDLDKDSISWLGGPELLKLPNEFCSPLTMASEEPVVGEELIVVNLEKQVKCRVKRNFAINKCVANVARQTVEEYRYDTCFSVEADGKLEHGDSGSPILRGNEVVGILIMGPEDGMKEKYGSLVDENIVFMKMSAIRNRLS